MTQDSPSRLSPLDAFHRELGAKMADFGGWMMPIEYPGEKGGVLAEHRAVRERVGIFDVSHLGKASVRGEGAVEFLNNVLSNDLESIADGQAQYNFLLDETGGVVDDLIVYRKSSTELFLIPNAANTSDVVKRIQSQAPSSITVTNLHLDFAVIAVQGPNSLDLLRASGFDESIATLAYMSFARVDWNDVPVVLCRTGYTGEFGFEAVIPVEHHGEKSAWNLWNTFVKNLAHFDGAVAGLGARDTLRTEMGYPLHGQDLSLEINPVEASAGWAVGWKKPRFIGRDALLAIKEKGAKRKSFALKVNDRGIPRQGMTVVKDGRTIGFVTSGTFSPTLKSGIALALLEPTIKVGDQVDVEIRGRISNTEVVKLPFVPSRVR